MACIHLQHPWPSPMCSSILTTWIRTMSGVCSHEYSQKVRMQTVHVECLWFSASCTLCGWSESLSGFENVTIELPTEKAADVQIRMGFAKQLDRESALECLARFKRERNLRWRLYSSNDRELVTSIESSFGRWCVRAYGVIMACCISGCYSRAVGHNWVSGVVLSKQRWIYSWDCPMVIHRSTAICHDLRACLVGLMTGIIKSMW